MTYKFIDENKEHLHTLDLKPLLGTTTVIDKVLAKPLTWWASGMAVSKLGWLDSKKNSKEARLTNAEKHWNALKDLTCVNEYLQILDEAYKAHNERKVEAADAGTELHEEIEVYIKNCIDSGGIPSEYSGKNEKVDRFSKWALKNVKQFLWSEKCVFSGRLWLGGVVDLGYIDQNDELFIGDIKSSKEAYFNQFVQCALYHIQIEENKMLFNPDGSIAKAIDKEIKGYAIFPFGNGFTEPTIRYASPEWKNVGELCVSAYKLMNATN